MTVACFFGDGAINRGPFLGGAQLGARVLRLPVLFVCEDNRIWSATTAERADDGRRQAPRRARRALDIPATLKVDGNDVFAVHAAASTAR